MSPAMINNTFSPSLTVFMSIHDYCVSCKADGGLVSMGQLSDSVRHTSTEMCQSLQQTVFVFMHEHHVCTAFIPQRMQVQTHAFTNKHTNKPTYSVTQTETGCENTVTTM